MVMAVNVLVKLDCKDNLAVFGNLKENYYGNKCEGHIISLC